MSEEIEEKLEIIEEKKETFDIKEFEDAIVEAAKILQKSTRIVFFTGAGMSAESGIDTFRGSGGFWSGMTGYLALGFFGTPLGSNSSTINFFSGWNTLSRLSWSLYVSYFYGPIAKAKPNKGHEAISELENYNKNVSVITQNVDGLHQRKFEFKF
jgi:NAD-dependent deacetylase